MPEDTTIRKTDAEVKQENLMSTFNSLSDPTASHPTLDQASDAVNKSDDASADQRRAFLVNPSTL